MPQLSGLSVAGLSLTAALFIPAAAGALPVQKASDISVSLPITQVLVFGKNSRQSPEQFAAAESLNVKDVKRAHAASGLVECGEAHGAGQLTLVGNVITTAAHVFYDEQGALRGTGCTFAIEIDGRSVRVPVDLTSIKAGSTNPYAFPAVHDWAVAKLTKTIADATPYQLSDWSRRRRRSNSWRVATSIGVTVGACRWKLAGCTTSSPSARKVPANSRSIARPAMAPPAARF